MPNTQVVTRINGAWVSLLAVVLVTALLWAAKAVLLPLALGIILAFTLSPLVRAFDKLRLPRFLGVALTMGLALGAVGGAGYVIANQFADLSTQVTRYTSQMRQKATDLRLGSDAAFRQFTRTVDRVTEQLDNHASELRAAQPVRVVPSGLSPVERLRDRAAAIFEPLASAVIVLVLVAFMLGQREDLRDRLIRLTGTDHVILTTRLLDEAAQRVSRYLVAQTLVNICLGALVAAGLYWIGVPYAALWGGLTAVLRFVPYVGTLLSALLPAALAFAIFPGWSETLQTLAMFLVLDLITGYGVEPLLFGRRTGVSSFALLVSALFWIWVWGPVGLLLATPLTVCIAVLGRHVRSLRFLAVLFADEPALQPHVRYYQRLLAHDEDEAHALASRMAGELGAVIAMDEVLIPALRLAEQHRSRAEISQDDMDFIVESTAEIVGQIRMRQKAPPAGESSVLLLGVSGAADRVVLDMLAVAMEGCGHAVAVVGEKETATEAVARVLAERPDLTCVVAVSSTRGAEARGHCRRIRAALPAARLLVLRPLPDAGDAERSIGRMKEAGADRVAITLRQALEEAEQLLDPAARPAEARLCDLLLL
ncbi:MAG TPA: AI-2E family transporter [Povalibacter sp.]|uniref:AI-2E family transporter n=1 Tax=Povalibacter sp. TaxID=1962978 RepID=UPI002B6F1E7E|nr:AI-2E family transporter [Povalibacter sp.]HMN46923.1 AI-2E family transporter [Povalibacter sp.]